MIAYTRDRDTQRAKKRSTRMSDVVNRGLSLFVTFAFAVALLATINVPNNPARRLFDILREMF